MAARLDADATLVVEEARSLARRYQHDAVDLDHLLSAILTHRDSPPLSIDGVSRPELLARLDARLSARPRSALYRDSARVIEPSLSPGVETALRRAAAGGGLGFFRAITMKQLLVAVVMEPTLAALVAEAGIESEELEVLLGQARTLAAVHADPSDLRESLDARLAVEPQSASGLRVRRHPWAEPRTSALDTLSSTSCAALIARKRWSTLTFRSPRFCVTSPAVTPTPERPRWGARAIWTSSSTTTTRHPWSSSSRY